MDTSHIKVNHAGLVTGIKAQTVSMARSSFAEPDAKAFKVRGPNYLVDKVKVFAESQKFHLAAIDVYSFETPEERYNVGARQGSFASLFKDSPKKKGKHFTYMVNLILPSDENLALVMCFQPEDPDWHTSDEPWAKSFREYIACDPDTDHFKTRFKLIPKIIEGNFMIRKTVYGNFDIILTFSLAHFSAPAPPAHAVCRVLLRAHADQGLICSWNPML